MAHPDQSSTRTWLTIAVVFVALWVAYLAIFGPRPPSSSLERSGPGEKASYDWTILDLKDRPESFARFKGKTVFLNVWATWCPPCVAEMPSIARLAEDPRLAGKGIAFLCVSVNDEAETVRTFLEGKAWKMEFFRRGSSRASSRPKASRPRSSSPPTAGSPPPRSVRPSGTTRTSSRSSRSWRRKARRARSDNEPPGSPVHHLQPM